MHLPVHRYQKNDKRLIFDNFVWFVCKRALSVRIRIRKTVIFTCQIEKFNSGTVQKGVGPGTTLAWPGWKQNKISVKVEWHDSKEAGSVKVVYYCTAVQQCLNSRILLLFTGAG